MSKLNLKINLDLGNNSVAGQIFDQNITPLLSQAVQAVGQQLMMEWQQGVYTAKLWEQERDQYAGSIDIKQINGLKLEVFTDYKYASDIENGRPARDLKDNIDKSSKSRISKKGTPYLIIPFRHGIPKTNKNPMSNNIYGIAKQMTPSTITALTSRQGGTGKMVPQRVYQWGQRMAAGMSSKLKESHKSDPTAGMVRMDVSTGGQKRSSYLTFRVMSKKSDGWIVPPKPGMRLAETALEQVRPLAEQAFRQAIKMTFKVS
ncbi:hypothetical protein [Morganella phage Mecenats66]|nr:hypothetical protein [Morganella phage Mecenats66]